MYFVDKSDGFKYFRSFDYIMFFSIILLSVFGLIVLSSAVNSYENSSIEIMKQITAMIIGIIVALSISIFDYRDIKNISYILYAVSIALLIAVLYIGIGREETGTQGWIDLKIITFQPSEIAKLATILVMGKLIENIKNKEGKFNYIKLVFLFLLPVALILRQPDNGTAMVFGFIAVVLVFMAGFKYRYLIIAGIMSIGALPVLWNRMDQIRKDRILTFLNPELDPLGKGYQVIRSKIAIGSGQLFGQGLFSGIQTNSGGIPVKDSDFIFAVLGEELGFVGAVFLILLFAFIIFRSIYISMKAKDSFGLMVAAGIAAMWMFHFIENIGMSIGLMPVTGIPLPFVSAGGSAMITNFMSLGVLMSISMRNK